MRHPDATHATTGSSLREEGFLHTLTALGLSDLEAAVYLSLADSPLTVRQVNQLLRLAIDDVNEGLARLRQLGLVKQLPGRTPKFALTSPQHTLRGLVSRQQEVLENSRQSIETLIRELRSTATTEPEQQYVELVTGIDALRNQFQSFQVTAQEEILGCVRAPMLLTGGRDNPGEVQALRAGVVNRWIYDRALLESPGGLDDIRYWTGLGEEARVSARVPSKLVIVDRTTALIYATEYIDGEPTLVGIAVRHPEVVATLQQFFEALWKEATPLLDTTGQSELEQVRGQLVNCLLAGMTDASISRALGLSRRTVARRIRELMDDLEVENRFQAGFKVAKQHDQNAQNPNEQHRGSSRRANASGVTPEA